MDKDSSRSIGRRLFRNALVSMAGRVWLIASNLFLTPLILSFLGQDRFAVWVLVWTLTQYFMMLDFGLGMALVKCFAECEAKGDVKTFNGVVSTGVCFYLALGAISLVLMWPLAPSMAALMALPEGLFPVTVEVFRLGFIILVILNLIALFDAILRGLQRMELANLVLVLVSVANVLGTYGVLRQGGGLHGLMMVVGGVYCFQLSLLIGCAKVAYPSLRCDLRGVTSSTLKMLMQYGSRLQVPRLAELISFQADKILLGLFVPIRYVTFYELGAKVSLALVDLPHTFFAVMFPAVSELKAQQDYDRLWLLYERGTKYLWLVSLPLLIGMWLTAHFILQAWLGHVSGDVYAAVLLLSIGYWSTIGVGMVLTLGAGMGWVNPIMKAGFLQGGLNLCLSVSLIWAFGYRGALYGTMVALVISNAYVLVQFCREFKRSLAGHVRLLGRVLWLNVPAAGATFAVQHVATDWGGQGRSAALCSLLGCVVIYGAVYLASIRMAGVMDRQDQELLGAHLPMVRLLMGRPA